LTAFLAGRSETFDVIVSADTLVYFGPLEAVVGASENALRPGGRLIFTAEELVSSGGDDGYAIGISGRYKHTRRYIQSVLRAANFGGEIASAELRLEAGEPVAGFVAQGTKPASG
jgi:predicted TPR repeat methyltransferase